VFALAPLPFGSLDRIWITIWIAILSASLATADYSRVRDSQFRLIVAGLLLFGVYAGVAWLQWVEWAGRFAAPIWAEASALLGERFPPRISFIATSPLLTLAPALLFAAAGFRAFVLATEPDGARSIARVIGWAAVAYAMYSAISLIVAPGMLLWRTKEAYLDNLTGTFINRNTAATYFGGAAIIWLLAFIHELRSRSSRQLSVAQNLQALLRDPPRDVLVSACCLLICFGAVAATSSRAGLLLTTALLGLAGALSVDWWSAIRRWGWFWLGAGAVMLFLLVEVWGSGVAARIERRGLADAGRLQVYERSLDIVADYPVLGIGLGAFESVFPSRRPAGLGAAGIWDRAHSTPLEMAVEMGLPMAVLVATAVMVALAALARASQRSRRRAVIIGFCVGLLGVLHSCVDFSLQIPGYAVTFAALTGAGLASLGLTARQEARPRGSAKRAIEAAASPPRAKSDQLEPT